MEADEIARIRSISLPEVLVALGAERDPKDPQRNWRLGGSRLTVTDSRFYDHNAAGAVHRMRSGAPGGGGAIDLVQYLKDVDFRAAVRELGALPPDTRRVPRTSVTTPVDGRPTPTPTPEHQDRVRRYLRNERAIPEALIDQAAGSGQVFADSKGNVVFRLRDETGQQVGFEVRGTYQRPYHSVHGEKGLFISKADNTPRAAFVESGIEALSYRALRGAGLVISTTGNAVEMPARMARALEQRGYTIVAAFNADAAGDRMSEKLRESLGGSLVRERPSSVGGKDWNDQLRQDRSARRSSSAELEPSSALAR
jgi:Toprim-like/Protein of unknown function (DUF3991)